MSKPSSLIAVFGTLSWIVLLGAVQNSLTARTPTTQRQIAKPEELEARISVAKSVVVAGNSLPVRIEIRNIGTQDLLICKDFFSGACELALSFEPIAMVEHPVFAKDCVPYEWSKSSNVPDVKNFSRILVNDWVSIPPKHFYGAIVELAPAMYPELRVPGHYHLVGKFSSGGLLDQYCYYKLKPFANEVASLLIKSWQGGVTTNSLSLSVTRTNH